MADFYVLFIFLVIQFVIYIYLFKWSAQWAYGIRATAGQALLQWIVFVVVSIVMGFLFLMFTGLLDYYI